ncbi:hypothetical protein BC936DRAFT_139672 [Jimgerdemannia flammicorona]|uniref:Uncharacterized protein n=1 Tax=Jimgerdemannia flammicorona TaxID=994334 RepID=A0A433B9G4_9FUNG|nr:hypothetical protein BC936DRAFT_139672 [Jimgerdemannia flammicorona]
MIRNYRPARKTWQCQAIERVASHSYGLPLRSPSAVLPHEVRVEALRLLCLHPESSHAPSFLRHTLHFPLCCIVISHHNNAASSTRARPRRGPAATPSWTAR